MKEGKGHWPSWCVLQLLASPRILTLLLLLNYIHSLCLDFFISKWGNSKYGPQGFVGHCAYLVCYLMSSKEKKTPWSVLLAVLCRSSALDSYGCCLWNLARHGTLAKLFIPLGLNFCQMGMRIVLISECCYVDYVKSCVWRAWHLKSTL